ncbi:hypothetical protein [Roseateles koreensis]|uniref:Uncharacterized protein n=1 Tax=Roseateles koreensis TaxID=2987526 RepID=A0ABT5KN59_9BURK|nr:hypothetical protein [Roseateles koreensis]MDC8784361.1 hypothetical protein [Roseateles koreensis]
MMIIPLHLIADTQSPLRYDLAEPEPSAPLCSALDLGLSFTGPVESADLLRFQALMAVEGLNLQPTRMLYDRLYACEQLAQGHASGNPTLRELALQLFNSYQQAGTWIGLVH